MDENNSRTISMSKQIKLNKGYITIVDDKYYAIKIIIHGELE